MTAYIFDMDGLLVDTEIISLAIYQAMLSPLDIEFTKELYVREYSGKTELANLQHLIQTYHLDWTLEEALHKVEMLETYYIRKGIPLKKGAKSLLLSLKQHQYKLALATSSKKVRAMQILQQHGLAELFDTMICAENITHSKPHPEIFLKACQELGELPENSIVFEDSEAGIEAAYRAGIPVICIPDMKYPQNRYLQLTTAVYKDLEQAQKELRSLNK